VIGRGKRSLAPQDDGVRVAAAWVMTLA
jgi:hypothetical protein